MICAQSLQEAKILQDAINAEADRRAREVGYYWDDVPPESTDKNKENKATEVIKPTKP